MYNRYHGNTGRYERVEEPAPRVPPSPLPPVAAEYPDPLLPDIPEPHPAEPPREQKNPRPAGPSREQRNPQPTEPSRGQRPPSRQTPYPGHREPPKKPAGPLHDLRGSLDGLLSRIDPGKLETEDYLVLAILYLMYRESRETEFLIALGAYLFL